MNFAMAQSPWFGLPHRVNGLLLSVLAVPCRMTSNGLFENTGVPCAVSTSRLARP